MTQTQTQPQANGNGKAPLTLTRNGLRMECFFDGKGRLARKIERYGSTKSEYAYRYDSMGHLSEVDLDGGQFESYAYNHLGRRSGQTRHYQRGGEQELYYNDKGQLVRIPMTGLSYDKQGALEERDGFDGVTQYFYNGDTMLDRVVINGKKEIRYEYDASTPLLPARRFRNGTLSMEFAWDGPLRLSACRNHDLQVEYTFIYDTSGLPDRIRLKRFTAQARGADASTGGNTDSGTGGTTDVDTGGNADQNPRAGRNAGTGKDADKGAESLQKKSATQYRDNWFDSLKRESSREDVHDFLRKNGNSVELYCGCDQAGTLKLLTDANGNIVKEVLRDSFGFTYQDSFPGLHMPIGFAGGLEDPDTGFVRFGWRDYDPEVGRFTAPDPARDTRGDGDLYDYCVDDPVNAKDPTGLWTRETFDESRVRRNSDGEFSSGGGGGKASGTDGAVAVQGLLLADAGQRAADAGPYATDAGHGGMGTSSDQMQAKKQVLSKHDEMIQLVHGDEVLALSREADALIDKRNSAVTEKERGVLNDQIGTINEKIEALTRYEVVFSKGFRDEQQQVARQWQAQLTTPDNARKYVALMEEIENAPFEDRQQLVQEFFSQLAHDAGMPQTQILVVDDFATRSSVGRAAGAYANGYNIVMDADDYRKEDIFWANNIKNFFHEQGHDLLYKAIAPSAASDYPEDIAKMRRARSNYAEAASSSYWYKVDYTEQHARTFEQNGADVVTEWNNFRQGNKR